MTAEDILTEIAQEKGFATWEQYFDCFKTTDAGIRVINKGILKAVNQALILYGAVGQSEHLIEAPRFNFDELALLNTAVQDYSTRKSRMGTVFKNLNYLLKKIDRLRVHQFETEKTLKPFKIYTNTTTVFSFMDRIRILFGKEVRVNSFLHLSQEVHVIPHKGETEVIVQPFFKDKNRITLSGTFN